MRHEPEPTIEEFERDYLPTLCHCGTTMKADEAYYAGECTECVEGKWHELRHWKAGGTNKELDKKFGIEEKQV